MVEQTRQQAVVLANVRFWRAAREVTASAVLAAVCGGAFGSLVGWFAAALVAGALVAGGMARRLRYALGFVVVLGVLALAKPLLSQAMRHAPYLTFARYTFLCLVGCAPIVAGVFVMAWSEAAPADLPPFGRSPKLVPFSRLSPFAAYPVLWAGLWTWLVLAPAGNHDGPFDDGSQVCGTDDDCFTVGGCSTCNSCYSRAPHRDMDCDMVCEPRQGLTCKCRSGRCVGVVPK